MYCSLPVFIEEFLASFMSLLLASSVPLCAAVSCPFISIIFLPEPNTGFAAERSFPRFRTVADRLSLCWKQRPSPKFINQMRISSRTIVHFSRCI